jgi:hypothetical protein
MNDVCLLNIRPVDLFRNAITDTNIFNSLIRQDVRLVANKAISDLSSSDIRGFIYRCFTSNQENAGLAVVNEVVTYTLKSVDVGLHEPSTEILEAAIGILSVLSANNRHASSKLFELMQHNHPLIVTLTVNNLGRSTNIGNLEALCNLLLHPRYEVRRSAVLYIEACTRDAAFRRPDHESKIEDNSEDFLRRILVPLEHAYGQLDADSALTGGNIQKRIAILTAMIYNEILDSTDWKRINKEDVDERIYFTLEQHLHTDIGPAAIPSLIKMIGRPGVEQGVKQSALNTLGRMSNDERHRKHIALWIQKFTAEEKSEPLLHVADKLADAIEKKRPFSSIPVAPFLDESSTIVPRKAGAPLKSDNR